MPSLRDEPVMLDLLETIQIGLIDYPRLKEGFVSTDYMTKRSAILHIQALLGSIQSKISIVMQQTGLKDAEVVAIAGELLPLTEKSLYMEVIAQIKQYKMEIFSKVRPINKVKYPKREKISA